MRIILILFTWKLISCTNGLLCTYLIKINVSEMEKYQQPLFIYQQIFCMWCAVANTNTPELDQKLIYCSFNSIQKAFNKQYNRECLFSGCENDMKQSSLCTSRFNYLGVIIAPLRSRVQLQDWSKVKTMR